MTNYKIISKEHQNLTIAQTLLSDAVMDCIRDGWIPQGGISITTKKDTFIEIPTFHIAQAMVKH